MRTGTRSDSNDMDDFEIQRMRQDIYQSASRTIEQSQSSVLDNASSSSSHNVEPTKSMDARMAGLSIHDPPFPRTTSDSQKGNAHADRSTGSSNPSNSSPYNNAQFSGANNPSPASTSAFNSPRPSASAGPTYRKINGNLTRYDNSVHQTNISSFNTQDNKIKDSFNDNSLVDSTGRCWCHVLLLDMQTL